MVNIKRGTFIASTLMLVATIITACNKPYSSAPAVTFTPVQPNDFFASAEATGMSDISAFATGSAIAAQTTPLPGEPVVVATETLQPGPEALLTATNTPLVSINPTSTSTIAVAANDNVAPMPVSSGSQPSSYTLQPGEFVYCVARRFNMDPDEVLALNGLIDSETIYAGLTLTLPQTGHPFPGDRMLQTHPTTYIVSQPDETVYSVACKFGDVDPSAIASVNNISVNTALTINQALNIP